MTLDTISATIVAGGQALPNPIEHRGQSTYKNFYINWLNLTKSFVGGAGQYMCKALQQKVERGKKTSTNSCTRFPQASCFVKMHHVCQKYGGACMMRYSEKQRYKKRDEKLDSRGAKKGAKKLVSSDCKKILEIESSDQD